MIVSNLHDTVSCLHDTGVFNVLKLDVHYIVVTDFKQRIKKGIKIVFKVTADTKYTSRFNKLLRPNWKE